MTTPKPTPEEENSPEATKTPPRTTGFFNRVQRTLQPKPEPEPEPPIHPTEAAEIVIMDEDD